MDIDKNLIEEALKFYEINDDKYIDGCKKCINEINHDLNLKFKIDKIYDILYIDNNNKISQLWNIKSIDELFENKCNPFVTNILLLLGYKIHLNNMKKYNFDKEQCDIHKKRVRECLTNDIYIRKYEGIRISQMLWGAYFINVKLIECGILQYEFSKFNPITKDKELCIKIHIPKIKKLDISEVKLSLNKSELYIYKYFKLSNPKYYCVSWLLSNQIKSILNKNSNIAKFQDLFNIVEGKECIDDILNFVFNLNKYNDYYQLNEQTSLQRNIKKFLIDGKIIKEGIGILK